MKQALSFFSFVVPLVIPCVPGATAPQGAGLESNKTIAIYGPIDPAESSEVSPISVEAPTDIDTGILAHWEFEETSGTTVSDSSGNNHTGSLQNGASFTEGKIGNAVQFDGIDDYVVVPHSSDLTFTASDSYTLAAWVNVTALPGHWAGIVNKSRDISPHYGLWIDPTNRWVAGDVNITGSTVTLGWHHLALVQDSAANSRTVYVDGQVDVTGSAIDSNGAGDLWFGGAKSVTEYLEGVIDDVRIYSRALSADDITELMSWVAGTKAKAGTDRWVYGNEVATLDGTKSTKATTFAWTQVKMPGDPDITITNANQATATFTPPGTQIGYTLTFRLTVTGETGTDSDEVQYFVRAINVPKVAPTKLRVQPVDQGATLGFRLLWDRVFDAEKYQGALKLGTAYFWLYNTTNFYMDFTGMGEGAEQTVVVRGENKFCDLNPQSDPSKHGLQSQDITYKAMRNLALPATLAGGYPPLPAVDGVTYKVSHYAIAGMNNMDYDDNNDSWDGQGKSEDFWGYLWDTERYFDRLVYYGGQIFGDGGWFTSLGVQYTKDGGTTWIDVPGATIVPPYDLTDSGVGRKNFTRYDIYIPTVRGTGIRIHGTPGGSYVFTSIAELEVYGDQSRPAEILIVQGVDGECGEGLTATLDGSATFSTRGPITSWKWEKVSGPAVTINNSTSAKATFTAPVVASDTQMVFKLTAGDGAETLSDSNVQITIRNLATTAVAGPDQNVYEGDGATLDGSGSISTTGSLSYLWTQTGGTLVGVAGKTTAVVNFTAPILWGYTEDLTFQLKVDDGAGGVRTDEVKVQVRNKLGAPIYPVGPGYLKDLLRLGADPTDRIMLPSPLSINTDYLAAFGGEALVNPLEGDEYDFTGTGFTVKKNPMVWTPLHDDDGFWGDEALDNFIQYYHIYIISPEQRDARAIFRHDDEMRCWNNGAISFMRDSWDGDPGDVAIERSADFTLYKGVNSMTFKFHEGGGGNYLAVRFTDRSDVEYTDLYYSFGPSFVLADSYASRALPDSYQAAGTVDVSLSFRVNPANIPGSVSVREVIPPGIPPGNITAPGATIGGGGILWTLTGAQVKTTTLTYSMTIPEGTSQALDFAGTVSFGTTSSDISGESVIYPVPTEPTFLMVEMLMAAHLSWSPAPEEGVVSYNVFRSVNGGAWTQIGSTTGMSFVDSAVTAGNNYSYAVSAIGVRGVEGPQTSPTTQASLPGTMIVREAEDFNYDGGKFPWTSAVTVPALEAPSATDLGTPQQYDYFHPSTGGPTDRSYRPLDNTPEGLGIETVLDDGTTDVYHTNIGWIDPGTGSWYRFGFNVAQAGWIKLTFRVACPDGATIAAYWDEELIGTASFDTNSWHTLTWVTMEQFEETQTGEHHLRVALVSGAYNFDKIAIGYNWAAPKREAIFADNFDTYSTDADVKAAGWTIENGSGYVDAAWRLWDTEGPLLGNQDPNLAGMYDKYMITDSDLAPEAALDERLVTKEIDCTNHMKVRLNFSKNYRAYDDPDHLQVAEVDIRVFDNGVWGDWVNLLHWDRTTVTGTNSSPEQVDIASLADKKKIRVRWHFSQATWDYWFAIDQVRVSGEPLPEEKPRVIAIGKVGNTVTLGWKAFGAGQYTVQQTDNLPGGTWVNAPGTWPVSTPTWTSGDVSGSKKLFYRVTGL